MISGFASFFKISYLCALMETKNATRTWLPTLLILLCGVVLFVLNLMVGSVGITLSEFFAESESSKDEAVILGRWRQLNERDKRMLSSLADAMIREK